MSADKHKDNEIMAKYEQNPIENTNEDIYDMDMKELPMMNINMNNMPMFGMPMQQMNMPQCPCNMIMSQQQEMPMYPIDNPNMDMINPEMQMSDMNIGDNMNIEEDIDINAMRGSLDDFEDIEGYSYTRYYNRQYYDVDDILEKIERYNPGVFRRLAFYGVPFPAARNIVRRIIRLTLNYYR